MATVLVVDDTALARESVAKLLEYEGFDTIRAANGRDGWATMYDRKPDLILLDLMMPMMDGVTFLRLLRRSPLWKDVPVIVLTGVTDDNRMVKEARALGISDLVPKASFGFDDLLSRVKKVVPATAEAGA